MRTVKMCSAHELVELCEAGVEHGYEKTINPANLSAILDATGWNVLAIADPFVDFGRHVTAFHRCRVLAKLDGSMIPLEFDLDVSDRDFRVLTDPPELSDE